MKYFIFISSLIVSLNADLSKIKTFEADFTQTVQDEQKNTLRYKGHIIASKPQYALWKYTNPIKKDIYISMYKLTVIEPDMEQAIVKNISSDFNLFKMLNNAKKIAKNQYLTKIQNTSYIITTKNENVIAQINYRDELDNIISIEFSNQILDKTIDEKIFTPKIPLDFDIISQ